MKDYSTVNNSTRTVTPDCESVNPLAQLSQTNNSFLPTKIGHQTAGAENHIEGDTNAGNATNDINQDSCKDNQNSFNKTFYQTNDVENNHGVTGISGTGHTIIVNQCPDELIQLLVNLLKKSQS
jgi:hypothetical protein